MEVEEAPPEKLEKIACADFLKGFALPTKVRAVEGREDDGSDDEDGGLDDEEEGDEEEGGEEEGDGGGGEEGAPGDLDVLAKYTKEVSTEAWNVNKQTLPAPLSKNTDVGPAGMLGSKTKPIREAFVKSNNNLVAAIVDLFVVEEKKMIVDGLAPLLSSVIGECRSCLICVVVGSLGSGLTFCSAFCQSKDRLADGKSVWEYFNQFKDEDHLVQGPLQVADKFDLDYVTRAYISAESGGWLDAFKDSLDDTNGLGFILALALFAFLPLGERGTDSWKEYKSVLVPWCKGAGSDAFAQGVVAFALAVEVSEQISSSCEKIFSSCEKIFSSCENILIF